MGTLLFIAIIVAIAIFLASKGIEKKENSEVKNNFGNIKKDFESELLYLLDDYLKDKILDDKEQEININHIYAKGYLANSKLDYIKYTKVIAAKLTKYLENKGFKFYFSQEKIFDSGRGISYLVPFSQENYLLNIETLKIENNEYYVLIAILKNQ